VIKVNTSWFKTRALFTALAFSCAVTAPVVAADDSVDERKASLDQVAQVSPAGDTQSDEATATDDKQSTLAPESAAALAKLQQYMDNTKSLTANFSSILLDDTGRQTDQSSGTLAFKVPGKFRWQYENPDPDSAKITEGFDVVGSHMTEGDQWIVLKTRDSNSDFVTVRIKFSEDAIQLMELIDRVDQTSRIAFSEVVPNAEIDDSQFEFEVPKGASLIGTPSER